MPSAESISLADSFAASSAESSKYPAVLSIPRRKASSGGVRAACRAAAYLLTFLSGTAAAYALLAFAKPARPLPIASLSASDCKTPTKRIEVSPAADLPVEAATAPVQKSLNPERETPLPASSTELHVAGLLEPAPGRFVKLPLATSQAIAFVDVQPGDRVQKGWQVFSHWESPDRLQVAKTELAKTKKLLEVARLQAAAAEKTAARLQELAGRIAAQELQDAETAAEIRLREVEGLQLAVSESESRFAALEFEFKQAFVTTPIDGIVAAVDVTLGERRQAGGPFRGVTILDPTVLHCRCLLDQDQVSFLNRLAEPGNHAVSYDGETESDLDAPPNVRAIILFDDRQWPATVAFIGLLADTSSGLTPMVLEVPNADGRLRCGMKGKVVLSVKGDQP